MLLGPQMADADLTALASLCPTRGRGSRRASRASPGCCAADDQGLEAAVDHLASLGHRRIAFVDGPRGQHRPGAPPGLPRRDGAARPRARGRGRRARRCRRGRRSRRGRRGCSSRPAGDRPTGVVAFNDRVAIGLRDACCARACGVPEEVSVVGYDDSPIARLGTIDLTSVSQEPEALADATVAVVVGAARRRGAGDAHGRRRHPASPGGALLHGPAARSRVENTPRGPARTRRVLYSRRLGVSGRPRRCAPGGAPWPTASRPRRSRRCPWRPRWCTARRPRRPPPRRTWRARGGTPR